MKQSTRGIIISVIIVPAVILSFIAYRAHKKFVTQGEFYGVVIGEDKEATFRRLIEKENVTYVTGVEENYIEVRSKNISDLKKLKTQQAFKITGPKGGIQVYLEGDRIVHISRSGAGWQMAGTWNNINEILPLIEDFLKEDSKNNVHSIVKGYGFGFENTQVLARAGTTTVNNIGYDWLATQNKWQYSESNRYTYAYLRFVDGKLESIDYTNNFIEMP